MKQDNSRLAQVIRETQRKPQPERELKTIPVEENKIEQIIYAVDPVTGLPCSDLALTEQQLREPAVQAYLAKFVHRERVDDNIVDDTISPDLIPDRRAQIGNERDAYINGLREVLQTQINIDNTPVDLKLE